MDGASPATTIDPVFDETDIDTDSGGQCRSRAIDRAIAELAQRQHGVVARWQLERLGLGRGAIDYRIQRGRLHAVYPGVYAVGHRLISREGRWMAAVLAVGPDAVLIGRSAAALWGILPPPDRDPEIAVARSVRGPDGVKVRDMHIPDDERTTVEGIPVTTVPRTILDIAATEPKRQAERAINEAEFRRLTDHLSLPALIARYPRRRGTRAIKAILSQRDLGRTRTRSELEEAFLAFVDEQQLPRPLMNESLRINGRDIEPDAMWPEHKLIIELDSRAAHDTQTAFEKDRERDRSLIACGWRTARITWRQLHQDRDQLAADLRTLCRFQAV